jgi:hypothetical protein
LASTAALRFLLHCAASALLSLISPSAF